MTYCLTKDYNYTGQVIDDSGGGAVLVELSDAAMLIGGGILAV
jgi:hypothetical protein